MVLAFSYVRFSSARQTLGLSLERQLERTAAYCREHGLTLDDSLRDEGLSGFHGTHLRNGALGRFRDMLAKGTIPAGSVLVVEALDRLSRQKPRLAQEQLLSIVNHGVEVVTLIDGQRYSRDSLDANYGQIFMSIGIMIGAHTESANKADRSRENFTKRRGTIKNNVITWIKKTSDGLVVNEAKAKIVRYIWTLNKSLGFDRIAKKLNDEKVPTFSPKKPKWDTRAVGQILRGKQVLGIQEVGKYIDGVRVLTGETFKAYPAIISEADWLEAQAIIDSRRHGVNMGRNVKQYNNVFGNLARCDSCGGRMMLFQKDRRAGTHKTYSYLGCQKSHFHDGCTVRKFYRVDHIETRMAFIFGEFIEGKSDPDRIDQRATVLATAKAAVAKLAKRYQSFADAFADDPTPAAQANLRRLGHEHTAATEKLAKLDQEQARLAASKPESTGKIRQWFDSLDGLEGDELVKARAAIANGLPTYIKAIRFKPDGSFDVEPMDGYRISTGALMGIMPATVKSKARPMPAGTKISWPV